MPTKMSKEGLRKALERRKSDGSIVTELEKELDRFKKLRRGEDVTTVLPTEKAVQKQKQVTKAAEVVEYQKQQVAEKKAEGQRPVMLEFPKITDTLIEGGSIQQSAKGDVRGMPIGLYSIPKEELGKIPTEWEPPETSSINTRYPLIDPYAYANIRWDEKAQDVLYTVIEPPLTKREQEILERLRSLIIDLLDINLMGITEMSTVQKYLREKLDQIIGDYEVTLTEAEYNKILYYIYRNFLGLDRIEPMMQDAQIEDISCDGVSIPIFVFHRKYASLKTNITFDDSDELNRFITKLAQRCGKHISVAEPLLDGALPDGSRLQATYSSSGDIATKGSTFTIRKFTKDPLTIVDFITFGTIPSTMAAYLWLAIESGNSVLISGGTATGKTSALNVLCLFLHPEKKIVSIEDTPELSLPHEHWVAKIARTGYGPEDVSGKKRGEISMFDLLRAALRERPEEIVVGEVRGKEAYVLFQGMATGHAGMATIHAESMEGVVNRLITPPINLSSGLLQHLNLVVIMTHARVKGVDVRRVKEIVEIVGIDPKTNKPITNTLFRWVPSGDYYEFSSDKSFLLNKITKDKGVPEKSVWDELNRRKRILEWMKKENIRYYKDVGRIIAVYYKTPDKVLAKVIESGLMGEPSKTPESGPPVASLQGGGIKVD